MSVAAAMFTTKPDERWVDQSQSLEDTLASYTIDGAYTEFAEDQKGMLKAGMLADIAVLSSDLESNDAAAMKATEAVVTLCDGRIVHDGR